MQRHRVIDALHEPIRLVTALVVSTGPRTVPFDVGERVFDSDEHGFACVLELDPERPDAVRIRPNGTPANHSPDTVWVAPDRLETVPIEEEAPRYCERRRVTPSDLTFEAEYPFTEGQPHTETEDDST